MKTKILIDLVTDLVTHKGNCRVRKSVKNVCYERERESEYGTAFDILEWWWQKKFVFPPKSFIFSKIFLFFTHFSFVKQTAVLWKTVLQKLTAFLGSTQQSQNGGYLHYPPKSQPGPVIQSYGSAV